MTCEEYREWVAADVDGCLGAEEAGVRAHLAECGECRADRSAQKDVRAMLRSRDLREPAPPGLRTRILAHLDEAGEEGEIPWTTRVSRWAAVLVTGLAALVVLGTPQGDSRGPGVEDYYAALRGEMALSIRTESIEELERFYRDRLSGALSEHVVDLGEAGFRLVGAALGEEGGRPYRLTIYSDGRRLVVCDYRRAADYAGEVRADGKPVFFSRAGLTFCVRRMGDDVCILVTRMPMHMAVPRLLGWT